jgi:hypothetical protein
MLDTTIIAGKADELKKLASSPTKIRPLSLIPINWRNFSMLGSNAMGLTHMS